MVVAVKGDVEAADRQSNPLVRLDDIGDAMGQGDPASLDTDQRQVIRAAVLLHDLVADANERTSNLVAGHDLPAHGDVSLLAGLTGPVPGGFG